MDLQIRDRNALLVSAGLRPAFPERDLNDEQLRPLRIAIEAILERHNPYPASAMDALGRVLMNNAGARAFSAVGPDLTPEEALDSFYAPGSAREATENWDEVAWAWADRLRFDASHANNPRLTALAERAQRHLEGHERPGAPPADGSPVTSIRFRVGDQMISTFATVMRFEAAHEVTISELRVELMFPMDDAADAFFHSLVNQ